LSDGGYVSFGKSINHDECLTDSSHVRAALHLVGAICRPIPGEPNRCMLTRIAQLDPKGNIPTMVVNATKKKSGASVILLRKVIRNRNLPPVVAEDNESDDQEGDDGDEQDASVAHGKRIEEQDHHHHQEEEEEEEAEEDEAMAEGKLGRVHHRPSAPSPSSSSSSSGAPEVEASPTEEGEVFFESATSLPWDERPFKQMYGQHRDEVNQIVSSLQQSLGRLEQISLSNEQRLQVLERLCTEMTTSRNRSVEQQQQGGRNGLVDFTNLSWGTLAFLAVWPVVAYSVYDLVSSRMRPPRK
jgi:hypothetical protein